MHVAGKASATRITMTVVARERLASLDHDRKIAARHGMGL
jgi:hypothetical protein